MCGIVGVIARPGRYGREDFEAPLQALRHRGPDFQGAEQVYSNERWDVWFGHTRLSILDLSEAGHQPMHASASGEGRGSVIFNGEVYNHRELRSELSTEWEFRSTSDTEVLLAGLLLRGDGYFARLNSMMAVGYLDHAGHRLLLARDRLGKKPLFVYRGDGVLAFASELKAFAALGLQLTEDPTSRAYYNWLRHVPATATIYREVRRVPAGSYLSIDLRTETLECREVLFWDPLASCSQTFQGNYDQAIDEFLSLLDDATRLRLDADVPVGLFLSGGIDSTLVASSIAAQHNAEITAFIFKNEGSTLDESEVALETARRLGLQTEVITLGPEDFLRQVDKVGYFYDDPCSPVSQLATMALSEAARKSVTVILTGDGGDEVFLGYPWVGRPGKLWRIREFIDRIPFLRTMILRFLESSFGYGLGDVVARFTGRRFDRKRELIADLFRVSKPEHLYDHWLELWPRRLLDSDQRELLGRARWSDRIEAFYPNYSWNVAAERSLEENLAAHEMVSAMRDEILVKVDRGTMAYSLEARSPLLDYRIVEFGLSLPLEFKRTETTTKRILRDACSRRVGFDVASRPKTGFSTSIPETPGTRSADPLLRWSDRYDEEWRRVWSVL